MKQKERLSMRLPALLVDALDAAAKAQRRSRSNYVDWLFTRALAVAPGTLDRVMAPITDKRMRMISFRVPRELTAKLDRAAAAEKRTRTEVAASLLAGSFTDGWSDLVAELTPKRAARPRADANVFA